MQIKGSSGNQLYNTTVINLPDPSTLNTPVRIELADTRHQPLLAGPPHNLVLCSGQVSLAQGDCVHSHSTEDGEELLIALAGRGWVTFADKDALTLEPGSVIYIPPHTTHQVSNTGSEPLVYVYVYGALFGGDDQTG